jgi:hypothetical protein
LCYGNEPWIPYKAGNFSTNRNTKSLSRRTLFGAVGYLERQKLRALLNDTLNKSLHKSQAPVARANTFCTVAHFIVILNTELASGRLSGA